MTDVQKIYSRDRVVLREVGLRDGLQLVKTFPSTDAKRRWVRDEYAAGVRCFEVGSFLPAKTFPQFVDVREGFVRIDIVGVSLNRELEFLLRPFQVALFEEILGLIQMFLGFGLAAAEQRYRKQYRDDQCMRDRSSHLDSSLFGFGGSPPDEFSGKLKELSRQTTACSRLQKHGTWIGERNAL